MKLSLKKKLPIIVIISTLLIDCLSQTLFSCTFETDICAIRQDTLDSTNALSTSGSFDWIRWSGATPTSNTGPETGYLSSYFIFIETSDPQRSNDVARIFLPVLPSNTAICLSFYYHMYGSDMGSLRVLNDNSVIWSKTGNLGDVWLHERISTRSGSLAFEGIKGADFRSDMSLDNIQVDLGSCGQSTSLPWKCNFENDFCSVTMVNEFVVLSWTRATTTTRVETGPKLAASGSWFIYVNSHLAKPNNKAILETPSFISQKSQICLHFQYHMYGTTQGSLSVYVKSHSSVVAWEKIGQNINSWTVVDLTATVSNTDNIGFIATVGQGIYSDIALDDISIEEGPCQIETSIDIPFLCSFETKENFCLMKPFEKNYWNLGTGMTPTSNTGPNSARDGDWYMYFEASNGNERSGIETPVVLFTGPVCVSFFYHVYGNDAGQLSIYTANQGVDKPWWAMTGNQGNYWHHVNLTISLHTKDMIGILGKRFSTDTSDFAIDKFEIADFECAGKHLPWKCNFENTEGWCDMRNGQHNDNFDWLRFNMPSITAGTGANAAQSGQWYLYVDSDGRKNGDKAILHTPRFAHFGAVCLTFYYNMNGINIASLKVGTTTKLADLVLSGSKSNSWHKQNMNLNLYSDGIVFEAVIGSGNLADIAIDNILVEPGNCKDIVLPFTCDFELPEICNFVQLKTDHLDWIRHNANTPSINSGPDKAVSGNWFLYVDTRSAQNNDRALLETPSLSYMGDVCLSFYYYMWGNDVGHLVIYSELRPSGAYWWHNFGSTTKNWIMARVDIRLESENDRILFDVAAKQGDNGDIAIDKVDIITGPCLTSDEARPIYLPFNCDFETDFCKMTPSNMQRITSLASQGNYSTESTSAATLQSQPILYSGSMCLQIDYYMYNVEGNLQIGDSRQSYWSVTANQGQFWRSARVTMNFNSGDYVKITMTSAKIVVDRLMMDVGACSLSATTEIVVPTSISTTTNVITTLLSTNVRLPFECRFEFDFCSMIQSTSDNQDWIRIAGATPSDGTGPGSAQEGFWYMYMDARLLGYDNRVVIYTPALDYNGAVCLTFFYYMWGRQVRRLYVYGTKRGEGQTFFDKSGEQENKWLSAEVDVILQRDEQLVFVAVRGTTLQSDIAVDYIRVSPNPCSGDLFSCDGEIENAAGSCYLTQISGPDDELQWLRNGGKTPSGMQFNRLIGNTVLPVTGPNVAQHGQYYLYVEASNTLSGQSAKLSLNHFLMTAGNRCLRFWYSMNGYHMGALRVVLIDSNTQFQPSIKWELNLDQKSLWEEAAIDLNLGNGPRIEFHAILTGYFSSDVAIDYVRLEMNSCQTVNGFLWLCDFEIGSNIASTCNIEQITVGDDFNWLLQKGPTPSQSTGPEKAYSGEYYLYIEASKPRKNNDVAKILLPVINSNTICLEFSYNMFGFHINELSIYKLELGNENTLWTKTKNQGPNWFSDRITITNLLNNRIGFRAKVGTEYSGDIAIDSIHVRDGAC